MAIASFGGVTFYPRLGLNTAATPAFTTTQAVIDAADEKVAWILRVTHAGDISKFSFRTGTVTTGATVDVRVETVDPATGFPTGTLWGTNTNASLTIANTDDNLVLEVTFTAAATVAVGDVIAFVVVNPGTSFGNMQIVGCTNMLENWLNNYMGLYTTSWSIPAATMVGGIEYSDGFYTHPCILPLTTVGAATSYNSGTNPNHRGMRFRLGTPARVVGLWASLDLDGDGDLLLVDENWDGSDGDALGKLSFDKDIDSTTGVRPAMGFFASAVTLQANTTYRIVFKPTTVTSAAIYVFTVSTNAKFAQMEAGVEWYYTTANNPNDASDWTDTTTSRPMMGLILNGYEDGASGGGGNIFNLME